MSQSNSERIAKFLNKNFYKMSFGDKKKILSSIITEDKCDEFLIKFLAQHYNINPETEKIKLGSLKEKTRMYRQSIYKDSESDSVESPEPIKEPEEVKNAEGEDAEEEDAEEDVENVGEEEEKVEEDAGEEGEAEEDAGEEDEEIGDDEEYEEVEVEVDYDPEESE